MADKQVKYKITLDGKQFDVQLDKINQKSSSFEKKLIGIGKTIGGVFAAKMIAGGVKKLTDLWDKQAQAVAQVEQGIKSTGGAAGLSLNQLIKEASALQDKTIFGDEDILQNVTAQFLTFGNITGDVFLRAQKSALDLATRLKIDTKGAAIQLGKALDNPIKGINALARSGVSFTDEQKEFAKKMVDTGRITEAQTMILGEIERQYGGSAEAARKAGKGGFKALGNTLADLGEVIGKRLIKSSGGLADKLNDLAKRAIKVVDTDLSTELRKTRIEMNAEINVLKKGNLTVEERQKLIAGINEKYGKYLPNLITEKSSLQEIEAAQKAANKELFNRIQIAAKQELIEDAIAKATKKQKEFYDTQLKVEKRREQVKDILARYRATGKEIKGVNKIAVDAYESLLKQQELVKSGMAIEAQRDLKELQERLGDVGTEYEKLFGETTNDLQQKVKTVAEPSKELQDGITTIKSSAPKTFNINIDKFVENFSVNSQNITEGATAVKERFINMWIEMLADAQAVGG